MYVIFLVGVLVHFCPPRTPEKVLSMVTPNQNPVYTLATVPYVLSQLTSSSMSCTQIKDRGDGGRA